MPPATPKCPQPHKLVKTGVIAIHQLPLAFRRWSTCGQLSIASETHHIKSHDTNMALRPVFIIALLAALSAACHAQFDGSNFGQPKICRPFQCPRKNDEPVPKWPYKVKSMGCASSSGGMMAMKTSKTGNDDDPLEDCCHAKQACLQTCGSVKHLCQEEFMKCGERTCKVLSDSTKREECSRTIELQKVMQSLDNCNEFDQYQQQNCQCVAKDKVPKARVNFLTRFYKKYNPDDVAKAEKLAGKADTVRKMSTLVIKLVQKYPEAIKVIEDPNQAMMDRILKESKKKDDDDDDGEKDDESNAEDLGTEEL